MKKKTPVVIFKDGDGNPGEVYHLDRKGDAAAFFRNVTNNCERDTDYTIRVEEWNQKQCADAEEAGRYEAGDMTEKEEARFIAKCKRRNKACEKSSSLRQ